MIGGKVLDASAVAAIARYDLAALAWLDTARILNIPLYLPTLALTEVRAVLPASGPVLADLLGHSSVVLGELDAATADQVDQLLVDGGVFDGLAGHVVLVARRRGWPVLTTDPGRLRRVDPAVTVDQL